MKCPKCNSAMAMAPTPEVRSDGIYNVYRCSNPNCNHEEKKKR